MVISVLDSATVTFRTSKEVKRELQAIANRDDIKVSVLMNQLVEMSLNARKEWEPRKLPKLVSTTDL